jgi:hypothetical protein
MVGEPAMGKLFFVDEEDTFARDDGETSFEPADGGEAFRAFDGMVKGEDAGDRGVILFRDIEEAADLLEVGEDGIVFGIAEVVRAEPGRGEAGDFRGSHIEKYCEELR